MVCLSLTTTKAKTKAAKDSVRTPVNPLVNPLENNREKVFRKVTNNNSTGSVDRSEYRDSKSTDNKKKKTNTELKIYSCNIKSINNKRKSIDEMLHTVQPVQPVFYPFILFTFKLSLSSNLYMELCLHVL